MLNMDQFKKIMNCKEMGLKRSQATRRLGLDYATVTKYWGMTKKEFKEMAKQRELRRGGGMKAAVYDEMFMELLTEAPERTTAQIIDLLKERTGQDRLAASDRTIYARVRRIREEMFPESLERGERRYEASRECGPGEQCQMDFGQRWLDKYSGGRVQVFFAAFVLSHSRYKYVVFQDRPFQAQDTVNALQGAYEYFGGRARTLVIDQDTTMVNNENMGDIIYSEVFKRYLEKTGQEMYVCRGSDPETKGKIESVVQFVGGNFLKHRKYQSIKRLNEEALGWLRRTGNGKVHSTTKKIPAEVFFKVEKKHLLPVPEYDMLHADIIIMRGLQKDNTFHYLGNRYQVPYGTYGPGLNQVELRVGKRTVAVFTPWGEHIYTHRQAEGRGKLVEVAEGLRRQRKDYQEEETKVLKALGDDPRAARFLCAVREDKPRYAGDQLRLALRCLSDWGSRKAEVLDAMEECLGLGEPSVPFLVKRLGTVPEADPAPGALEDADAPKRSLDDYAAAMEAPSGEEGRNGQRRQD